jgi:DNA ligase (NAD+)
MKRLLRDIFESVLGDRSGDGAATTFHPSQTCPECGSKLCAKAGSENWHCPNLDCPAQVRRGLVHWCSPDVMDIPGGDAALVAKLVGKGLARDVAELYRITAAELAVLEGVDKDSAQQFFNAITASMKRDAWRVLFGLNVPMVGAAEAQALGKGFPTVDAVFAAGVPRLMQDAGVSEAVARSVVRWHSDSVNRKLVKRLAKAGLNFKSELYQTETRK